MKENLSKYRSIKRLLLVGMFITGLSTVGSSQEFISTCEDLQSIENDLDSNYELRNNINCGGYDFEPIGEISVSQGEEDKMFQGILDGNGYEIRNLRIGYSGKNEQGFGIFPAIVDGAQIRNLGVVNAEVEGGEALTGGIVGRNGLSGAGEPTVIDKTYFEGEVTSKRQAGGVAGWNQNGRIIETYSKGTIEGKNLAGGIAGTNFDSDIEKSYSIAEIRSEEILGGITGSNLGTNTKISQNLFLGKLKGSGEKGGIHGKDNSYGYGGSSWDKTVSGVETSARANKVSDMGASTTSEMTGSEAEELYGLDFGDTWGMPEEGRYPYLKNIQQKGFRPLEKSKKDSKPNLDKSNDLENSVKSYEKVSYLLGGGITRAEWKSGNRKYYSIGAELYLQNQGNGDRTVTAEVVGLNGSSISKRFNSEKTVATSSISLKNNHFEMRRFFKKYTTTNKDYVETPYTSSAPDQHDFAAIKVDGKIIEESITELQFNKNTASHATSSPTDRFGEKFSRFLPYGSNVDKSIRKGKPRTYENIVPSYKCSDKCRMAPYKLKIDDQVIFKLEEFEKGNYIGIRPSGQGKVNLTGVEPGEYMMKVWVSKPGLPDGYHKKIRVNILPPKSKKAEKKKQTSNKDIKSINNLLSKRKPDHRYAGYKWWKLDIKKRAISQTRGGNRLNIQDMTANGSIAKIHTGVYTGNIESAYNFKISLNKEGYDIERTSPRNKNRWDGVQKTLLNNGVGPRGFKVKNGIDFTESGDSGVRVGANIEEVKVWKGDRWKTKPVYYPCNKICPTRKVENAFNDVTISQDGSKFAIGFSNQGGVYNPFLVSETSDGWKQTKDLYRPETGNTWYNSINVGNNGKLGAIVGQKGYWMYNGKKWEFGGKTLTQDKIRELWGVDFAKDKPLGISGGEKGTLWIYKNRNWRKGSLPIEKTIKRIEISQNGAIVWGKAGNSIIVGKPSNQTTGTKEESNLKNQDSSVYVEIGNKRYDKGEDVKVDISTSQQAAERGYQVKIEGPQTFSKNYEKTDTIYSFTPEQEGEYRIKILPQAFGQNLPLLGNLIQGGNLAETKITVTSNNVKWKRYCKNQNYNTDSISEKIKCVEQEIVPQYFQNSVGEKPEIAQSLCKNLLNYQYNQNTQKCTQ